MTEQNMNCLSPLKCSILFSHFGTLSARKAAIECGVNRGTAAAYYRRFRNGFRPPGSSKQVDKIVTTRIQHDAWQRLEQEAVDRTISTKELAGLILQTVARDGLFEAILDD